MATTATVVKSKHGPVLSITIDMEPPHPSSSGNSIVVASTRGFTETDALARFNGQDYRVRVSVNAIIKPTTPGVES